MSRSVFLGMRNFSAKLQKKSKHTFYFQNFFPQNRAVYEIMCKNVVQQYGASAFHAG